MDPSADWVLGPVLERVASALRVRELSPGTVVFFETINLVTALLLTWIFARYEHRRVESYGLPVREAFGARYWEGFAIGVVNAGAVALGMIALGGMTVHGLSLHGSKILSGALAWLGACALVGVAEELLFRGYLLQTLWRSLGFLACRGAHLSLVRRGSLLLCVVPVDHLLNASFQGPAWVTGGVLGTEASFLMYPSLALLLLYTRSRFRRSQ